MKWEVSGEQAVLDESDEDDDNGHIEYWGDPEEDADEPECSDEEVEAWEAAWQEAREAAMDLEVRDLVLRASPARLIDGGSPIWRERQRAAKWLFDAGMFDRVFFSYQTEDSYTYSVDGLVIQFDQPKDAMMFKLAFGGDPQAIERSQA